MLKQIQRLPFAPVVALMFAAVAAILVLATPVWLLEHVVYAAGLPDILPAAAPPLGSKARFLLVVLAAGGTFALAFLAALPLRDAKPRKPQSVTVQPLRRDEFEAAVFNRPSVFTPPVLEDEPNLPSFLAQPLAQMANDSVQLPDDDGDELLLDTLMIVEDEDELGGASFAEVEAGFRAAIRNAVEDVPVILTDLPPMPEIFIQPETVLHLEPAPVPPPPDPVIDAVPEVDPEPVFEAAPLVAPRPRIVEQREPTIEELMERFQRGLETLKRTDAFPLDDLTLRHALAQLERIAVGGR